MKCSSFCITIFYLSVSFALVGQSAERTSGVQLPKQDNNPKVNLRLAKYYDSIGVYDSALIYIRRANLFVEDENLRAEVIMEYAEIALSLGYYSTAQDFAFKAIELYSNKGDSAMVASAYNKLGRIAEENRLFDKSIEYYEQGLKFDPESWAIKNNIGATYLSEKTRLFKAVAVFQECLDHSKKVNDAYLIAVAHYNLAEAFLEFKLYDSALVHIKATWDYNVAAGDSAGIMFDSKLFGKYYKMRGQLREAKHYLLSSLSMSAKFGSFGYWNMSELPKLYTLLSELYLLENKPDSSLYYQGRLIDLQQDHLRNQRISTTEFALSVSEEDFQNFIQREKQNRIRLLEYLGITLTLLVVLLAYLIFAAKDLHRKYAPYLSSAFLILFFEFILVILDPFLSTLTDGDQLYVLLSNALLALLLIPIHKRIGLLLDRWSLDIKWRMQ